MLHACIHNCTSVLQTTSIIYNEHQIITGAKLPLPDPNDQCKQCLRCHKVMIDVLSITVRCLDRFQNWFLLSHTQISFNSKSAGSFVQKCGHFLSILLESVQRQAETKIQGHMEKGSDLLAAMPCWLAMCQQMDVSESVRVS